MPEHAIPKGDIVVLLGNDGSGKSSVLRALAAAGYATSTWRRLRDVEAWANAFQTGNRPSEVGPLLPPLTRATYVLSAIYSEWEFVIAPQLQKTSPVVVESYYIRPLAKELVWRGSDCDLMMMVTRLPRPSLVIHIDVAPEVAYERKQRNVSAYEVFQERSREGFIRFQNDVMHEAMALLAGVPVISVDGTLSPAHVAAEVTSIMEVRYGPGSTGPFRSAREYV